MPRAPDLSGRALDGRYELHGVIGEGTFGRVYRGRDRRLARWVAVKVIKPWWAEDPEWARSFEREAQLLASVSDPGIIQIFDVGAAPEGLYYVAELVEGESLANRLHGRPLAPAEAREIGLQLATALARAHAQRVVHRDVKPANVLITPEGRVKVGDFGVARLAEGSGDTPAVTIAGTPGYMAPEQASGGTASPATDVYAVGIVLYEMLAGHPPFQGRSAIELALHHAGDAPPSLPAGTPQPMVEIVARALAKDPAHRYHDCHDLASALARVQDRLSEHEDRELAGVVTGSARNSATGPFAPAGTFADTATATRSLDPVRNGAIECAPVQDEADRSPPAATRVGNPRSPRRNFNPSERRQRTVVLALAVLIAAGMGALAVATARGHLTVPDLAGMTRGRIIRVSHRDGFRASFTRRFSDGRRGTAIGQNPRAGTRVSDGAKIAVVLSAGPRPVTLPDLIGSTIGTAQSRLQGLRLKSQVTEIPAPGGVTGTIMHQSPLAGASLLPGSSVRLDVAQPPQLWPLTSFSGGSSVPFKVRGKRWEIFYSMGYDGTCTFIFFCSGPSATVTNVTDGQTVEQFDLGEGGGQERILKTGPGIYQVSVTPGVDSAHWKIRVDDYY